MVTTHGEFWHREVHAQPSSACPLCSDENLTFSKPEDLTDHIEEFHAGTFTESQVQAIVRQSQLWSPRGQDICPLCCLSVNTQQASQTGETENDNDHPYSQQRHYGESRGHESKRARRETGDTHLGHNDGSNVEAASEHIKHETFSGPSSGSTPSSGNIGGHVAGHLQNIMLLTLRLISIDVAMEVSVDHQKASSSTDRRSTLIGSSNRSVYQDTEIEDDFSMHQDGEIDLEIDPSSEISVPDCEHIDWSDVSHIYEASAQSEFGDLFKQPDDQFYLGYDLEDFISDYPKGLQDEGYLGQDLEEFIANPPMGAPRDKGDLGWDLESFISNHPIEANRSKEDLVQDLEEFVSKFP